MVIIKLFRSRRTLARGYMTPLTRPPLTRRKRSVSAVSSVRRRDRATNSTPSSIRSSREIRRKLTRPTLCKYDEFNAFFYTLISRDTQEIDTTYTSGSFLIRQLPHLAGDVLLDQAAAVPRRSRLRVQGVTEIAPRSRRDIYYTPGYIR